ncbi:TonB-dependent receptor [Arcticibacter svalbardensis MN12-7]|uniref:TonB-dependent receptor n=2 Tax=Arcticibacter TaxID=1288026 RepID=R9GP11_9SPHI|nr:TonB-dependent receptor [Arcticibacter svalbardensis MN12-7]
MLFFVVLSSWSYAQTGSISGQVLDETNQPLPGASISITSLNRATSTDGNGQFKLNAIPTGTYSISASFIGFQILKRNVTVVSGDTKVNIKLTPLAQNLTEVVVIGYGTQQKRMLPVPLQQLELKISKKVL